MQFSSQDLEILEAVKAIFQNVDDWDLHPQDPNHCYKCVDIDLVRGENDIENKTI